MVIDSSKIERLFWGIGLPTFSLFTASGVVVWNQWFLTASGGEWDVPFVGYLHGMRFSPQFCGSWRLLDELLYGHVLFPFCWDLSKQQWMVFSRKEGEEHSNLSNCFRLLFLARGCFKTFLTPLRTRGWEIDQKVVNNNSIKCFVAVTLHSHST